MKLNQISNNPGAHKHKHKVGRGSSSGLGKTSGRGVKGAKARTGTKVYGFEGGQMPLHMRIPKRGFNNIFANDFSEVNIGLLQKAIDDKRLKNDGKITEEVAAQGRAWRIRAATASACWARAPSPPRSTSKWPGVSAGAREAVEKAGGSVTATFQKKVYTNKKGEPGKRQKRRSDAAREKGSPPGLK